jgi:hypothetical protein
VSSIREWDLFMSQIPDLHQIDLVIHQFLAAFDNRDGRRPCVRDITDLMAEGAVIARRTGDSFEMAGPIPFAQPRVDLLASGDLTDFHEWETSSRTDLQGQMAVRSSRYAKEGIWSGKPYSGAGTKCFQLIKMNEKWLILSVAWEDDPA